MNRTERFYRIDQMLHEHRLVPIEVFLDELDISRATFKRDMEYLRDRLHAPIVWDRDAGGYRFESIPATGPAYELPGLWFTAGELYALLAAQKLLADIEPGILAAQLAPLQSRLAALLESSGHAATDIAKRMRLIAMNRRSVEPRFFSMLALALLERRRVEIDAWNRGRDTLDTRVISPQRLVHYRDNWYLDAWCHDKKGLRIFAVECIRAVEPLAKPAKAVTESTLNRELASSYGIFAGLPHATAVLRFTAKRARWVADEIWHPQQQSRWLEDGRFELAVPYSDDRELLMDILKYGPDVEVLAPEALLEAVKNQLDAAAGQYRRGKATGSGSGPGGK